MTTAKDTRLLNNVFSLIGRLGKTLTFTTYSGGEVYNPLSGSTARTGDATHSVVCSPPIAYRSSYVNSELIEVGDVQVFVPAKGLTFTPYKGQKVTFDSNDWNVLSVATHYAQDDAVLYELQMRASA